ncbi:site-specific integrase [Actinacidiphila yeochonensis]|uniref:hypothetical protein n=1 Tax=Actinacidiphila yeochonensis TaxID=89050 RepID=UPI00068BF12B|nr:hypothetical protein [Actinacidiphila yeochonensis]
MDGAGTITIDSTRTIVYDRNRAKGERNKVVEKGTKTDAGRRTLPLPRPVRKALRTFQLQQGKEKEVAGTAYAHSGYILVDMVGRPWKTDKLRREAYKLTAAAGSVRFGCTTHGTRACRGWPTTGFRTLSFQHGPGTRT